MKKIVATLAIGILALLLPSSATSQSSGDLMCGGSNEDCAWFYTYDASENESTITANCGSGSQTVEVEGFVQGACGQYIALHGTTRAPSRVC